LIKITPAMRPTQNSGKYREKLERPMLLLHLLGKSDRETICKEYLSCNRIKEQENSEEKKENEDLRKMAKLILDQLMPAENKKQKNSKNKYGSKCDYNDNEKDNDNENDNLDNKSGNSNNGYGYNLNNKRNEYINKDNNSSRLDSINTTDCFNHDINSDFSRNLMTSSKSNFENKYSNTNFYSNHNNSKRSFEINNISNNDNSNQHNDSYLDSFNYNNYLAHKRRRFSPHRENSYDRCLKSLDKNDKHSYKQHIKKEIKDVYKKWEKEYNNRVPSRHSSENAYASRKVIKVDPQRKLGLRRGYENEARSSRGRSELSSGSRGHRKRSSEYRSDRKSNNLICLRFKFFFNFK